MWVNSVRVLGLLSCCFVGVKVMAMSVGDTPLPKVVVGVDFGTTYSGFAFAHRSDPEEVHIFIDWPGAPRSYCKTQTSLFYVPGEEEGGQSLRLDDWSWNALDKFVSGSKAFRSAWVKNDVLAPLPEDADHKVGIFATSFKLLLAVEGDKAAKLAGKLEVERLVVDYLASISEFIMRHLQEKYGSSLSKREVQWCLTVPAIWSDQAKQKMQVYAEKAGLVAGKFSSVLDASVYPLRIILEPEAASFSCQRQLQGVLSFAEGDKFLVADVGGGTIDIVVHEKESAQDWMAHKVREVSASSGDLGGGTYVDSNFLKFLERKIGCFDAFKQQEPDVVHRILSWWLGPKGKCTFDGTGSKFLEVPAKLSKAWKQHDKAEMGFPEISDYYDEIEISSEQMKAIFDTEVDKTIKLIDDKLRKVDNVKYILLVGGFSESRYLFNRIKERFQGSVEDVLSPPNPGAVVCRGAVALGVGTGVVLSRISKKSYGIAATRFANRDDPPATKYIDNYGLE